LYKGNAVKKVDSHHHAIFGGALGLAGLLGQQAQAQQATHADSGQLEEIVVTAEKREATIETTAISITALSGGDIQDRGFTDLASLMKTVPGVSIRTSGPGMTEFEMRGVASNGGNSPTVGFYFDETSLTAPAATNEGKIVISPDLYDLNRVEVLRGPQGTLYGSGSMGGTIKVVPNAPNPEAFDASAEVKFADTDHGGFDHAENGMVNLPFWGDKAALRIVASYSYDSGWIDRVVIAPGQFPLPSGLINGPYGPYYTVRGNVLAAPIATEYHDVNDVEKRAVRLSAVFKPVDGLTITPSYFYQRLRSGGLPYIDSTPGTDAFYQPFDTPERYSDEFRLEALSVKYHTDAHLKSARRRPTGHGTSRCSRIPRNPGRPICCRLGMASPDTLPAMATSVRPTRTRTTTSIRRPRNCVSPRSATRASSGCSVTSIPTSYRRGTLCSRRRAAPRTRTSGRTTCSATSRRSRSCSSRSSAR
jgi:outer membrane receptor protein involved in Fe transport